MTDQRKRRQRMGFVDVQSGGGAGAASMSPSVAGGNHPMSNKSWLMSRLTVPPRFAKRLSPLSLSILSKINHQSHVKHNVFSCDWRWQDWVTEVGFFVIPLKKGFNASSNVWRKKNMISLCSWSMQSEQLINGIALSQTHLRWQHWKVILRQSKKQHVHPLY